jgi:hypothetical protein
VNEIVLDCVLHIRVTHPWTILAIGLLISLSINYAFIIFVSATELRWRDPNVILVPGIRSRLRATPAVLAMAQQLADSSLSLAIASGLSLRSRKVRRWVAVLATAVLVICVPITALLQRVWPTLQNAAILLAAIAAAIHYDHPASRLDQWMKTRDQSVDADAGAVPE